MKHTDLMLNDLVMCQGKILRVGCISDYDIKIDLFEDGEDTPYAEIWQEELDEVKPIPLTAEILEKNDFKRHWITEKGSTREEWRLSDDYYDIVVYEWSDSIWVFRYESCEMNIPHEQRTFSYVHNLQHALRECGIEKTIEI